MLNYLKLSKYFLLGILFLIPLFLPLVAFGATFTATVNPTNLDITYVESRTQIWATDEDGIIVGSAYYNSDAGAETLSYSTVTGVLGFPDDTRGILCGALLIVDECGDTPEYDFWVYDGEFHDSAPNSAPSIDLTETNYLLRTLASSTDVLLFGATYGLGIVIVIIMLMFLGLIYNSVTAKKPWH